MKLSGIWKDIAKQAQNISDKYWILENQDIEFTETVEWARNTLENDIAGFQDYLVNNHIVKGT